MTLLPLNVARTAFSFPPVDDEEDNYEDDEQEETDEDGDNPGGLRCTDAVIFLLKQNATISIKILLWLRGRDPAHGVLKIHLPCLMLISKRQR